MVIIIIKFIVIFIIIKFVDWVVVKRFRLGS
jgi:hypothetical protein